MINRFFKVGVNWFKLAGREIVLSICLGSIPLFLNSGSPKQLKEVMTILLANSFFLWHFAVLLLLWMVVSAAKRGALLQNGSTPKWLDFAHSLSCDLGGSFLTAIRTGLGAMIGFVFVWYWVEPETFNVRSLIETLFLAFLLMFLAVALARADVVLKDPVGKEHMKAK